MFAIETFLELDCQEMKTNTAFLFGLQRCFPRVFGLRAEIKHSRVQGVIDSLVQRNRNLTDIMASGLGDGYYFSSPVTQAGIHVYWNVSNSAFSMNRHLHAKAAGQVMREKKVQLLSV